jgi:hypothetical protein
MESEENPYSSPSETDSLPPINRRARQIEVPPAIVLSLCLLGILAYWGFGLLSAYGIMNEPSRKVGFLLYYVHWSSVGALIQFVASKKHRVLLGAIIGLILSQILML